MTQSFNVAGTSLTVVNGLSLLDLSSVLERVDPIVLTWVMARRGLLVRSGFGFFIAAQAVPRLEVNMQMQQRI